MSNFDPIRDCPHGRQKGKCDSCDLEQAEKIIEQQQQRIEELERKLRLEEELYHVTESGYTELFATIEQQQEQIAELETTVERLRDVCQLGIDTLVFNDIDLIKTIETMRDAIETTPQQNLNAIKREVTREAYLQGLWDANGRYMDGYSRADMCEEYLNKLYPNNKDNER